MNHHQLSVSSSDIFQSWNIELFFYTEKSCGHAYCVFCLIHCLPLPCKNWYPQEQMINIFDCSSPCRLDCHRCVCMSVCVLHPAELCLYIVGRITWGPLWWRGMASPRGREAEWSPSPAFLLPLFTQPQLLPGNPASEPVACRHSSVHLWRCWFSVVCRLWSSGYMSMLFLFFCSLFLLFWVFFRQFLQIVQDLWELLDLMKFTQKHFKMFACSILTSINC